MEQATTYGIKVSVGTDFQQEYSSPMQQHFVFSYRVTIENNSEFTIQLLKRHWFVYDSIGITKEVKGVGVVGNQPIIEPSDSYEYVSGCNLRSELGKMNGSYLFKKMINDQTFDVKIPEFVMFVPHLQN